MGGHSSKTDDAPSKVSPPPKIWSVESNLLIRENDDVEIDPVTLKETENMTHIFPTFAVIFTEDSVTVRYTSGETWLVNGVKPHPYHLDTLHGMNLRPSYKHRGIVVVKVWDGDYAELDLTKRTVEVVTAISSYGKATLYGRPLFSFAPYPGATPVVTTSGIITTSGDRINWISLIDAKIQVCGVVSNIYYDHRVPNIVRFVVSYNNVDDMYSYIECNINTGKCQTLRELPHKALWVDDLGYIYVDYVLSDTGKLVRVPW